MPSLSLTPNTPGNLLLTAPYPLSAVSVFNVKDYGAKGDGVTDDSAAVASAVTAAKAAGGVAYYPAGSYVVTSIPLYANTWHRGAGRDTTMILQKSGAASPIMLPGDATTLANNVRVSDMTVSAVNNQSLNTGGIQTSNMVAYLIENVGISYTNTFGFQSLGHAVSPRNGNDMYGTIRGCYFQQLLGSCVAIYLKGSQYSDADGTMIVGNTLIGASTSNIFVKIDFVGTGGGGRGYGADSALIQGNRTIGSIEIYDLGGSQANVFGNRHENNDAGSNMQIDIRVGSGGNTGLNRFAGNIYSFGGGGTLSFNDSGNVPSIRIDDPAGASIYDGANTDARNPFRVVTVGAGGTCPNGQAVPGFLNSWVYGGSSRQQPGFWKDHYGTVYLRGRLSSGTSGVSMFQLPTGYRPAGHCDFPQPAGSGATSALTVQSDGNVIAPTGPPTYVSLEGISFRVPMS